MSADENAGTIGTHLSYDSVADKQAPEARLKRMEMYAEWLAAPADVREPSTKKEVGKRLGISYETLKDYERDPRFQVMYRDRINAEFKVQQLGDVIHSLGIQAVDPQHPRSVQAARLLLDWMDKHSAPDQEESLRNADLEEIRAELGRRAEN
jgi:hypothetical protein